MDKIKKAFSLLRKRIISFIRGDEGEERGRLARRKARVGIICVLPATLGLFVFYVGPFIVSLYSCFTQGVGTNTTFVFFDNFINLFKTDTFLLAAGNSLKFILIGVSLLLAFSLALALLLNNGLRARSWFRVSLLLPMVVPVASVVMVWKMLFAKDGSVNLFLSLFGGGKTDWLSEQGAFFMVVMIFIWKNAGYIVVLFLAGLNNIPSIYYDAAKLDGCGAIRSFWSITLRFLTPTTLFATIISIANSFKVFREAYQLYSSYPPNDLYMLQHFMQNNFASLNYPRLASAALLTFAFISVFVILLLNRENRVEYD